MSFGLTTTPGQSPAVGGFMQGATTPQGGTPFAQGAPAPLAFGIPPVQQPGQTSDPYSMPGLTPEQRAQIAAQNNLFTSTIAPADQNSPQSMFNNYLNTVYSNYNSGDLPGGRVSPVINPIGMPYEQNPQDIMNQYQNTVFDNTVSGEPGQVAPPPPPTNLDPIGLPYEQNPGMIAPPPPLTPPPPTPSRPPAQRMQGLAGRMQQRQTLTQPKPVTPLSRVAQQAQAAQAAKQQKAALLQKQIQQPATPVRKPITRGITRR